MEFTGERYVPTLDWPEISYEHWHRYLYASRFVAGKDVLDVACGEGYGCDLLARHASNVVGVDLSPEAVAHAGAAYARPNLRFLEGPADALPFEGEALFDVVTSFETIEHIPAEAQEAFLAEVRRVLRPGGLLLISSPNKLEYTDKIDRHNDFHLREYYLEEFLDFVRARFAHVLPLGQRVYPVSYVWPAGGSEDADEPAPEERQIEFRDGRFAPVEGDDRKSCMYVIAACSDAPIDPAPGSLLVDLSGRAIAYRDERMEALKADSEEAQAHLEGLVQDGLEAVADLNRRLVELLGQWNDRGDEIDTQKAFIAAKEQEIVSLQAWAADRTQAIATLESWVADRDQALRWRDAKIEDTEAALTASLEDAQAVRGWADQLEKVATSFQASLAARDAELARSRAEVASQEVEIAKQRAELDRRAAVLADREADIVALEAVLGQRDESLRAARIAIAQGEQAHRTLHAHLADYQGSRGVRLVRRLNQILGRAG